MTARDHPAGASSEPIGGTLLVVAMPTLATRPTGTGPDRLRVLSLAGRAQADGLVVPPGGLSDSADRAQSYPPVPADDAAICP